jgi:transcriptional regulator with XRE-family HTH domain/tetratricopeptide (TPR) repeat protein
MSQIYELSMGQRLLHERLAKNWSQARLAEELGTSEMTVRRWEHDMVFPQARFREQLCQLFQRSNEELFGSPMTNSTANSQKAAPIQPLFWTVPYLRHPYFTGRENILETIHARFISNHAPIEMQALALTGLGGIGKSQVAIEYAYRYASAYCAVFWLAAETAETLTTSLQHIADLLDLPECQSARQSQMVAAVQRWLTTHQGWLLIGDNVEDLDLLLTVLPPIQQGTLLLTTRSQTLGALVELVEIPPMSNVEGATLLFHRARKFSPFTNASLSQRTLPDTFDAESATELVRLLKGLPLALDQVGSYVEETGCSIADYLQRYGSHRKHLLARRGTHAGTHQASVTTTLQLSIQWIEQKHRAAADLLRLCAFLFAEAIPEELLLQGAAHLKLISDPETADVYQLDLTIAALRNASLVTRYPEARTLSVHRLIQAVLQDQMETSEKRLWSKRAVQMVNVVFPEPTYDNWATCECYLAQALSCALWIEQLEHDIPEAIELLSKAGSYLMARGRLEEAEKLFKQASIRGEQIYGPANPAIIPILARQAELLWSQGKYEQTEPLYKRVLAIPEQQLGPMHPDLTAVLHYSALLYHRQEKYEQAEVLYRRALTRGEQSLGQAHLKVLKIRDDYSQLLVQRGDTDLSPPNRP